MSFLPKPDREYLVSKELEYEEVEDGNKKGVRIKNQRLPPGRYDAEVADILILLPPAYPDVAPDMFHLLPWVKLAKGSRFPTKAESAVAFLGESWQRWSRHNPEWRPGLDGIWTMLKRVEHALEVAA